MSSPAARAAIAEPRLRGGSKRPNRAEQRKIKRKRQRTEIDNRTSPDRTSKMSGRNFAVFSQQQQLAPEQLPPEQQPPKQLCPQQQQQPHHPHRRGKKKRKMPQKNSATTHNRALTRQDSAPFNTTQFIMNDHGDTIQYLDAQLGVGPRDFEHNPSAGDAPKRRVGRARDSSFCLDDDSDEDFYYSSPEDEEAFVNREFVKDYDSFTMDRLVAMSKGELINEYLQMEVRIDLLEKRLARARQRHQSKLGLSSQSSQSGPLVEEQVDFDFRRGEVPMEPEAAEKIRIFQREIHALGLENQALLEENQRLRGAMSVESSNEDLEEEGSVSSSSSSSCSSSSACSTCSESEEEEMEVLREEEDYEDQAILPDVVLEDDVVQESGQDTGYESGNSAERMKGAEVTSTTSTAF